MKILYVNNDGGGFADTAEVDEGTTVASLFADKVSGRKPADYLIRVNRLPASSEQIQFLDSTYVQLERNSKPQEWHHGFSP